MGPGGGGGRGREGEPKNPGIPNYKPTRARRRRDSAAARKSGAGSSPAPDSSPLAPPLHFPQYIKASGPNPQSNPAVWADFVWSSVSFAQRRQRPAGKH